MDTAGTELADRVRALLADEPTLEEKRMFGSRVFMVNDRILVGARRGGVLLVRLSDEHGEELVTRPEARVAVMGARSMGTRWLDVDTTGFGDAELMFWIDAAREDNAAPSRGPDGSDDGDR
ncbi:MULTISPECIES: TfoX/Sxy family protein [unclassified Microbacterium]|uniref:TfoX/Sxy family protein n=1 Tax=unclassified Microbacterium TaxID=2609290 RepID=UPI0030105746